MTDSNADDGDEERTDDQTQYGGTTGDDPLTGAERETDEDEEDEDEE